MYQKLQKAKGNLCVQNQHSTKVIFALLLIRLQFGWNMYPLKSNIFIIMSLQEYTLYFLKCVVILEDIFNLFPFSKKVPKTNIVEKFIFALLLIVTPLLLLSFQNSDIQSHFLVLKISGIFQIFFI